MILSLALGCDIHVDLDKSGGSDTGEPDVDSGDTGDTHTGDTAVDTDSGDTDTAPPDDTGGAEACVSGIAAWIPNTNTSYVTIHAAIDASGWRDTVRVCPGTWNEALVLREGTLTIEGYGAGTTILDGGGVSRVFDVPTGAVPRIRSLTVQNGVAADGMGTIGGGGLYGDAADVTLEEVVFAGNHGDRAGAVYIHGGTLTIRDSYFSANTAVSFGGAVTAEGATYLEVEASGFEGNSSEYAEGAVYVYHTEDATLTDCTFTANESDAEGGAIGVDDGGTVTITRGSFTDNVAGGDGAALHVRLADQVSVADSSFENNRAYTGGAIAHSWGTLSVTGSTFDGNEATYQGGAIEVTNTSDWFSVTIDGSEFTANTGVGGGGAMTLYGDLDVAVRGSTFSANDGLYGGAINVSTSAPVRLTLEDTTLDSNTAQYGSAFELNEDVVLDMAGGAVTRNVATIAGAIALLDGAAVTVDGTDWGEGATENLGGDVWQVDTAYGAGASFTCASSSSFGVATSCE